VSDVRSIDDPIFSSANLKPVVFAERIEFELFRDLELRLDLDPRFDLELSRVVERGEDGNPPLDSVESSCFVSSEYAGALDSHE
jgi:hypothetical protein